MSHNRKLQNSLTAAALATLITLGGGSAALANNYSLDKHNNTGSSTSQTNEQQKPRSEKGSASSDKKHKSIPDRDSRKKNDKAKSVQKAANAEQKAELRELKAQRLLINKEFRVAVQKANLALETQLADLTLSDADIELANIEHKNAIKAAHNKKRAAIRELQSEAKNFAKEYRVKVPKI
jgi:hypothetical protein